MEICFSGKWAKYCETQLVEHVNAAHRTPKRSTPVWQTDALHTSEEITPADHSVAGRWITLITFRRASKTLKTFIFW